MSFKFHFLDSFSWGDNVLCKSVRCKSHHGKVKAKQVAKKLLHRKERRLLNNKTKKYNIKECENE